MHPNNLDGYHIYAFYSQELSETPLLSHQEINSLIPRVRKGDRQARETVISSNLRLVVKIAMDSNGYGLPLLDAIQEGSIGLMRAVDLFDPGKRSKFSAYASLWIKQAIKRASENQSRIIRRPICMQEKISKMKRAQERLEKVMERSPTLLEISREMGISIEQVRRIRSSIFTFRSLDAPVDGADSLPLSECVADPRSENPSALADPDNRHEILEKIVSHLPERESRILRHRFGLDGYPVYTMEEIGKKLGITRERVSQIQKAAHAKLRRMMKRLERADAFQ